MGITVKFKMSDIKALKKASKDRLDSVVLYRLNFLGQECVRIARTLNTYKDQTGNLRNSIGYIITNYGKIIKEDFEEVAQAVEIDEKGESGEEIARQLTEQLAEEYSNNKWCLIVVAGMNYASYVEDVHGYAVLSPSKNYAIQEAEQVAKDILEAFKPIKI